ncbi:hypothetical protein [Stutzerimonas zhaodongensis]|nr:hypothetical protein [Stutzerimonas zhaodongensis]MCQ2030598.1 hypothetical protein [Stutzerimonas zhaodongensis]
MSFTGTRTATQAMTAFEFPLPPYGCGTRCDAGTQFSAASLRLTSLADG